MDLELSRDQATNTSKTIDIWKLRLDPKMERLTRWGDSRLQGVEPRRHPRRPGYAFESARSTDEAGVAYGLFILCGR